MERIASFQVDHNKLVPGMYLSRRDGNVTTFDLRFKKPNTGDLLTNGEMHSVEHVIATLLRNGRAKDAVIYFGPMGRSLRGRCRGRARLSAGITSIWMWSWRRGSALFTVRSSGSGRWRNWRIEGY